MKVIKNSTEFGNMLALLKKGKPASFVLTEEDITLGLPEDVSTSVTWEQDDPNKRPLDLDTRILITAKPSSPRYKDQAYYTYRRININRQWLVLNGSLQVQWNESMIPTFDKTHIVNYIKSRFKYIDSSLVYTWTAFEQEAGTATVTIDPIQNSYIYKGQLVLEFTKNLTIDKIPLQTAIPNNLLDGYDYETTIDIGAAHILGYNYSGRPEATSGIQP